MVVAALGVAAKTTTVPTLAVLCLLTAAITARRLTRRLAATLLGGGAVASALLLPPVYRLSTAFPGLRLPSHDQLFVGSFEPLAGVVNYLRYSMQSLLCLQVFSPDVALRIRSRVDGWSAAAGASLEQLNAWTFTGEGYAPKNQLFHPSLSYDPKVYVALLLVVAVAPWMILARQRRDRARVLGVFLAVLCGWAAFFALFNWQVWGGRLQVPHIAGLSALAGGALALRGRAVALAGGAVFVCGVALGLMSSVMNESKSTLAWRRHDDQVVTPWWKRPHLAAIVADRHALDDYGRVVSVLRSEPAKRIGLVMFSGEEFLVWKTLVETHGVFRLPLVYDLRRQDDFPPAVEQGRLGPEQLGSLDYIVVRLRRPFQAEQLPPGWRRHPATAANEKVFVLVRPTESRPDGGVRSSE
jgi:hypothetical protein